MYIQWFLKGIAGENSPSSGNALTWQNAKGLIAGGHGISSNWWRNKPGRLITPSEIDAILTEHNLDRHVHDYANYGSQSPFISVTSGSVERNTLLSQNFVYGALTTALDFATDAWGHPGAVFYGWTLVSLNPAVQISMVGEEIRNLNTYHRWSPFQPEGEITAKIHIPSNQIETVEWWDGSVDRSKPIHHFKNPGFVPPEPITNVRKHF